MSYGDMLPPCLSFLCPLVHDGAMTGVLSAQVVEGAEINAE